MVILMQLHVKVHVMFVSHSQNEIGHEMTLQRGVFGSLHPGLL